MKLRILSSSDVSQIICKIPLSDLMEATARLFIDYSTLRSIISPHRTTIETAHHTCLFMPSRIARLGTAIKIVSVPNNDRGGLPATTLVIHEESGAVKAIINARELTALRTAAGSTLATTILLPSTDQIRNLVVFGSGTQIYYHISLLLSSYCNLKHCAIIGRQINDRVISLRNRMAELHPDVDFLVGSPDDARFDLESAVRTAHIICTATSSTEALFKASWVSPGTHINLVGSYKPTMREVEDELIQKAGMVVVDSRDACALEAGEIISARLGARDMVELGELASRDSLIQQIKDAGEVTIFKSVGLSVQDVMISNLVLKEAERWHFGTIIDDYD